MQDEVDLIVIGAGSGGLTAAREGVRRGARTVLVTDGAPGGDCTFTGCVPSKTLLAAGDRGDPFDVAMATVHRTVAAVAATEDAVALVDEGIEVVEGRGSFCGARSVQIGGHGAVGGRRLDSDRIVIATGSGPAIAPIEGLEEASEQTGRVLTNETLFDVTDQPATLAVLGGGPIGCEMGLAFQRLGTQVTVLERGHRLLSRDEPEASDAARTALEHHGVIVRTNTSVTRVERSHSSDGPLMVRTDEGADVAADHVLVATGRRPTTTGLEPNRAGVRLHRSGAIVVDGSMATTTSGIWAIGDVTGTMDFTHAAGQMAMVAIANAFGRRFLPDRRFDTSMVPWVTFLDPEIAHIGMTERAAAAHGAQVAELPLDEVDRGVTSGRTDGFIKLIAGPRRLTRHLGGGRVLGATIVAPRAGEMINEVALAMRAGVLTGRLAQTVHAYPTWSMGIQEAAAQFFTEHRGRTSRPARAS